MESWGLLIFAGILCVVTANVELYSFFKETDSKQDSRHPVQINSAQASVPSAAASLLQVPVGFQLQLVPQQTPSAFGSPRTVPLPHQRYMPGSGLRNSDSDAEPTEASTDTHPDVRSDDSEVTTSPTDPVPEAPAGRSSNRNNNAKRALSDRTLVARNSNHTERQLPPVHHKQPTGRSQVSLARSQVKLVRSQPPNELPPPSHYQIIPSQASQLRK